jgi:hypothetical protein
MDIRSVPPIQVGQQFRSHLDETDTDDHGAERVTRAGSVWTVASCVVNARGEPIDGLWNVVCEATGAWTCPTEDDLRQDFTLLEEVPA